VRFARASAGTFVTQIVGCGLRIVIGALVARALGPEDKGVQGVAVTMGLMLVALGNAGLAQAMVYFAGSRRGAPRELVGVGVLSALGLGALVAALCWWQRTWILSLSSFRMVPPGVLAVALLIPGAALLQAHLQGVVRGLKRIYWYNLNDLFVRVTNLAAVVVLLLGLHLGVRGAVVAQAIGWSVPAALTLYLLWREFGVSWRPTRELLRPLLSYGIRGHPQTAADFLNTYRLDVFVLSAFFAHRHEQVGYFLVAVVAAGLLWFICDAVGTVLLPVASAGTEADANRFTPLVCRHTLFLTAVAGAAMMLLARPATGLVYSAKFLPAVPVILVLVPGFVVYSISRVLVRDLAGRGRPLVPSVAIVVNQAVSLALDFWLIPRMGILGAGVAYSVACLVGTAIVLPAFLLRSKVSLSETLLIRRSDFAVYRRAWQTLRGAPGAAPESTAPDTDPTPLDTTPSELQ